MSEPSSRKRFRERPKSTLSIAIVLTTIPLLFGNPTDSSSTHSLSEARPEQAQATLLPGRIPDQFSEDIRELDPIWGRPSDFETVAFFASAWYDETVLQSFGGSASDVDEVFHTLPFAEHAAEQVGSARGSWGQEMVSSSGFVDLLLPEYSRLPSDTREINEIELGSTSWGYMLPIAWPNEDESAATLPIRISLPPVYTAALAPTFANEIIGGIDYGDPSCVGVPLLHVAGLGQMPVSPNFFVRDFATRDNAPLARIAPGLLLGLERVVQNAGVIEVISGYRHRAYNESVRGVRLSRHISGQAADIWSPTRGSLDLARHVIEAMGCNIGLGLGRNTLHVDVRGTLATWTYPGAPLSERAFDYWVGMQCSGHSFDPTLDAIEISWMDGETLGIDFDIAGQPETPEEWIRRMGSELAAFATSAWQSEGPGAVIIDFIQGIPPVGDGLGSVVRYVSADSEESRAYKVDALIEWIMSREEVRYFVYAVELADGSLFSGISNMDPPDFIAIETSRQGQADGTLGATEQMQSISPPSAARFPQLLGAAEPGWVIVVGSFADPVAAEEAAIRYGLLLQSTSLDVTYWTDTSGDAPRYRIAVGHFGTAAEARQALRANASSLPSDAWLLPVGQ